MRLRSLVLPLTVLALTVGCKKPGSDDTTSPPGETSSEKGDSGDESESGEEGSDSGDPEDGGSEEGAGGPGGCEAEIAKVPAAYFGDRVIIKMPKGVEMAEMNPFYAQMPSKTESVCEVLIDRAAMGYFEDDPAKPIKELRDQTLNQLGFEGVDLTFSDESEKGRTYSGAYEAPASDAGDPPVKGWFVFKKFENLLFWVILETHPNAYPAIEKTFKASGASLYWVPPE
ncbi:MAG: hypothetical protein KC636_38955 [Myxococcales bacterium]|nr:hypothetical protein [Myxococcales bacterium]